VSWIAHIWTANLHAEPLQSCTVTAPPFALDAAVKHLLALAPGWMTCPVTVGLAEVVDVVLVERDVVDVVVLLRELVEVLERVVLVVLVLIELEVEKVLIGPEQILWNCCEVGSCGIQPPARPF
jgi:hypothetical protein